MQDKRRNRLDRHQRVWWTEAPIQRYTCFSAHARARTNTPTHRYLVSDCMRAPMHWCTDAPIPVSAPARTDAPMLVSAWARTDTPLHWNGAVGLQEVDNVLIKLFNLTFIGWRFFAQEELQRKRWAATKRKSRKEKHVWVATGRKSCNERETCKAKESVTCKEKSGVIGRAAMQKWSSN